ANSRELVNAAPPLFFCNSLFVFFFVLSASSHVLVVVPSSFVFYPDTLGYPAYKKKERGK
ncbi:hypothetical protein, partial [Methanocorpusculum sp. GPch4]|uniref:hypothetical protein n=1 Tax=Methanocorpusculum sp. GPch4 TaxID=2527877 RepID=UPI001ADEABB4